MPGQLEVGLRTFSQPRGDLRYLGDLLSQRLEFRVDVDLRFSFDYGHRLAHGEESDVGPSQLRIHTQTFTLVITRQRLTELLYDMFQIVAISSFLPL